MSVRPRHHRVPRARIDPICSDAAALPMLLGALGRPPIAETVVLVLDDAGCGLGVVSVAGTTHPDQTVEVIECLARPALFDGEGAALVVASARPGGGLVDGDVDRWLEMCDLADAAGLELIEWYVVGASVRCPRDLVGMPPRWPDGGVRPG